MSVAGNGILVIGSADTKGDEHILVFSRINHARDYLSNIGAGADEEEDDEQESIEVEERRLCCFMLAAGVKGPWRPSVAPFCEELT